MLLGFFFVRPAPLPGQGSSQFSDGDDFREPTLLPALQHRNHSRTPLLNDDSIENRYVRTDITINGENSNSVGGVMEATRSVGQKHNTPLDIYSAECPWESSFEQFGFLATNQYFLNAYVSFLRSFSSLHILYYKNSSWDLKYLYVSNLSKIFTGIIIPSLN
jgi:hypothetical protein